MTDEFLFELFGKPDAEEQLPFLDFRMSRAEYLSKLLCANLHGSSEVMAQMQKAQIFADNKDAQQVLLLRALLRLDQDEDHSMGNKIGTVQHEFNYAIMETAFSMGGRDSHFYRTVYGFRYDYLNAALDKANQFPLQAHKMSIGEEEPFVRYEQTFKNISYTFGHDDSIEVYLQERDREKLRLVDVQDFEASRTLAQSLLKEYSILRHQGILRSLVDVEDLCYTVCAAFATEILKDDALKSDMVTIVKGKAPTRMKFFTSLLYLSADNALQVGNMVRDATDEGYGKRDS